MDANDQTKIKLTPELVATTLASSYAKDQGDIPLLNESELLEVLATLQPLNPDDEFEHLTYRLKAQYPNRALTKEHFSQLTFIDECMSEILEQADLDLRIENLVRSVTPAIARLVIEENIFTVTKPHPLLSIVDQLCKNCIGWSNDLGILGLQFIEEVDTIIHALVKKQTDYPERLGELKGFFAADRNRLKSLEETLRDTGMTQLREDQARRMAVQTLNKEMSNRNFSLFIVLMLQGPWHEFLQTLVLNLGSDGKQWQNALKMTQAMIWSLQPIDESNEKSRQQLQQIMTTLPGQIRTFLESLPFDTTQVEQSLGDLEGEYETLQEGSALDSSDFEMLTADVEETAQFAESDAALMAKVRSFKPGQWFLYDDKGERIARIKLILKWDDGEQLAFSNQNRRKVLPMKHAELAYHLSTGVVKPLQPKTSCISIIKSKLLKVIKGHQRQKIKVEEVTQVEREQLNETYVKGRAAAREHAIEQARANAHRKKEREARQQHKVEQKVQASTRLVESLRVDAWVKLPIMEGILTECRLAAIILATDKYIFVNRSGAKVAEYAAHELVQSFITEQSEVVDSGAEFEDVLASVVTGLRADKEKSYDELSGE
jgi:hypothetical protein|tara:strand:- start:639 stop:2447 length:1809 start_codon:yes stop_codon:yes gene_type:complete